MIQDTLLWASSIGLALWLLPAAWRRGQLSRAKHPSLHGHARWAGRIARWLPGYSFNDARFFSSDGAPAEVVARRRQGMARLSARFKTRHPIGVALAEQARAVLPDLDLTSTYRVPFPYARGLASWLPGGRFVHATEGVRVEDVDGHRSIDLSGSYGVNLFGQAFYKTCIQAGARRVEALGPVLGALHPVVLDNVERLRALSGLDAVSFHMSGTEAVMQAVRLARYHTRRTHLVRFCGAYHGWWDDVQPGPGNPAPVHETYTLRDMDERSLQVLRSRRDIACVLVNPLQALHPNRAAPGDSALIDSSRHAAPDLEAYREWLHRLRKLCTERGIVLIFDEVFMGFRLAPGGAQQRFGVKADLVTYGKTLGGGLPVGVVCGVASLMARHRDDHPADLCFARGTFNAHPYVMGAMNEFLRQLDTPAVQALYEGMEARWQGRAEQLNARLAAEGLPVRVASLSTVWTVLYTRPSRYNWMLQFYLRDQGLALSWVGTGRLIFSLDFSDDDVLAVADRFVAAARAMEADGWWSAPAGFDQAAIRRQLRRELWEALDLRGRWAAWTGGGGGRPSAAGGLGAGWTIGQGERRGLVKAEAPGPARQAWMGGEVK